MAKISAVPSNDLQAGIKAYRWTPLTENDFGGTIEIPMNSDKSVHIHGNFGTAGAMTIYGSNNPADVDLDPVSGGGTWVALVDPQGNAITKTAAGIATILDNVRYLSCKRSAGTGLSVTVDLIGRTQ